MWSRRVSCASSIIFENDHPLRIAKHFFGSGFFEGGNPGLQPGSRTRMQPSLRGASPAQGGRRRSSRRWSKRSKSGAASSSGIHSRMACQGGSMGSNVSMSKGGSGGGGMSVTDPQRPWRSQNFAEFNHGLRLARPPTASRPFLLLGGWNHRINPPRCRPSAPLPAGKEGFITVALSGGSPVCLPPLIPSAASAERSASRAERDDAKGAQRVRTAGRIKSVVKNLPENDQFSLFAVQRTQSRTLTNLIPIIFVLLEFFAVNKSSCESHPFDSRSAFASAEKQGLIAPWPASS